MFLSDFFTMLLIIHVWFMSGPSLFHLFWELIEHTLCLITKKLYACHHGKRTATQNITSGL